MFCVVWNACNLLKVGFYGASILEKYEWDVMLISLPWPIGGIGSKYAFVYRFYGYDVVKAYESGAFLNILLSQTSISLA